MERFFKKIQKSNIEVVEEHKIDRNDERSTKQRRIDSETLKSKDNELDNIPSDPGLRIPIFEYDFNIQDQIRRCYLQRGPCQPYNHEFPKSKFGNRERHFNPNWFGKYPTWLEYSVSQDKAYCLYCYLFKLEGRVKEEDEAFSRKGFSNWKKPERFDIHVGGPCSPHNNARKCCEDLMSQKQDISFALQKQSDQTTTEYRIRLNASIDCIRFLLRQGLAFRGHDESDKSTNQGNFLELLLFLAKHNEKIDNVVLKNAPENLRLTAPDIQKEITRSISVVVTNYIIEELGDNFFSILVDEAHDISSKEQMSIILRYVTQQGKIVERFLAIVHVSDTTARSLKVTIEQIFSKYGLSVSKLRGQGYDGASNMRGEFNGLKALFLNENSSAHYIHCFSHQLQLALIYVAKNHVQIVSLFLIMSRLMNLVGVSCKRRDQLREKHREWTSNAIEDDKLTTGQGLNQEINLKRAGETRWGSHYESLVRLITMFSSIIDILEVIMEDGSNSDKKGEASMLLESIQSFEFSFSLHLMKDILGITFELSNALQRKEQDIVNAMSLVHIAKMRLQVMRDDKWEEFIGKVSSFCEQHNINIPCMEDNWVAHGRSRRRAQAISNLYHFRVEIFYTVIDMQLQELNTRFTESNTELLLAVACLKPNDSFCAFNKDRLIRMVDFYPYDFTSVDLMILDNQLETYIMDVRSNAQFSLLKDIGSLAEKMIQTQKAIVYPLVFKLLKLALILPVATASVERAFSAMAIIKNRLRNKIGDQWLNDILVAYIEKEILNDISNDLIIEHFQNMKTRRFKL